LVALASVVAFSSLVLGCANPDSASEQRSGGQYQPPAGRSMLEDAQLQWSALPDAVKETVCDGVRLARETNQYDAMVRQVVAETGMTPSEVRRFYSERC
jgi:hypothetical protein